MDKQASAPAVRTPLPRTPWRFCGNREIRSAVDPDNQAAETLVAMLPSWMPAAKRQEIGQHIVDCVNSTTVWRCQAKPVNNKTGEFTLEDGGQDAHPTQEGKTPSTEPGSSTGGDELCSEPSGDSQNAGVSEEV